MHPELLQLTARTFTSPLTTVLHSLSHLAWPSPRFLSQASDKHFGGKHFGGKISPYCAQIKKKKPKPSE